jgi:hypothetical protein
MVPAIFSFFFQRLQRAGLIVDRPPGDGKKLHTRPCSMEARNVRTRDQARNVAP